jgi:crossover junction endodeoxyribonuclease RuvC
MSRPVAWLGGDPGMGGALALLVPEGKTAAGHIQRQELFAEDMPALEIDGKRRMDFWRLAALLGTWTSLYDIRGATVEKVHAMPLRGPGGQIRQSPNGLFEFGFAAGALQQAVASAGIPMTLVHPATWKAVYGLRGGRENKDMSRQKASSIFPGASALWARKKDDGRAEAVLLAYYGSKLR